MNIDFEAAKREVQVKSLEGSEIMATIAEKLFSEGMEKGMEKGMEEGMEKVAKKMLAEGENIDKIIKFTGLSREEVEKLVPGT